MIKYFSLSRVVRQYRIILVLCTLYCLVYNNWSDNEPSDTSGKQLNEFKSSLYEDIPYLEKAQCSPVDTPPSEDGVTIVSYGRDTPDHHGYTELSSIIAGNPSLLDGVHASVGVLQGIVTDKSSSEMLHIFKHTTTAVVSLVNVAISVARDNDRGVDTMFRFLMEHMQSIKWVGLAAQSYVVSTINGMKVGFTALCVSHADCAQESSKHPSLSPVKYHEKMFSSLVNKLHEAGVMFIVVLAYWGRQHVVIPEDHTLLVAKQMSNIGANVIIGNHPRLIQDHAYMGNTLVIFSQGNAAINKNDMCWTPEGTYREETRGCQLVHPQLRERLKHDEKRMRLYKIMLSSNGMVHADYMVFELEESAWKPSDLKVTDSNKQWTRACSHTDPHCLMCDYF